VVAWMVAAAAAMPLQRAVERVLVDPALAGASVGVVVGPPDAPVVAIGADRRLVPASVTKLVTAAVVAEALPLDAPLETRVYLRGAVLDGVLTGDVVVVGGGDPSLGVPDPEAPLAQITDAVRAAGVRVVTGGVVADPSRFAGPPWGRGWMWDDLAEPWSPAVSGLPYARGLATGPCPGRSGPGTPVDDPAACFALALHGALLAAGLEVRTPPRVEAGPVPPAAPLVTLQSPPLRELLAVMLQASDNLYAETLWRLADPARPGTAEGARDRVTARFTALGSPDRAPVDGSGLSRYSSLSPQTLVEVAAWIDTQPWGADLVALLPVAGASGTLQGRFVGTAAEGRVQAKTGSMTGVRNLVGWVTTADGARWPFAVCLQGFVAPQAEVIALQDRIVALAASSRRGRVARSVVRDNPPPGG
jgi:D-alanyl-D-alanine carboxypeptidase/D-alanyl-D-alanine-endopeptidase (penicillin-binding protein 4)